MEINDRSLYLAEVKGPSVWRGLKAKQTFELLLCFCWSDDTYSSKTFTGLQVENKVKNKNNTAELQHTYVVLISVKCEKR